MEICASDWFSSSFLFFCLYNVPCCCTLLYNDGEWNEFIRRFCLSWFFFTWPLVFHRSHTNLLMIQTCRAVLKGGAKQAKSITKLHKEKMHLSDCRNDDEGYLIKKKVGELLVFLHHISLHLLLPNFFPSKTEDYLEKFTTMQAETKWLILEGKLTKIPFCLCLSFIFCPRKVLRWEESVKLLNAEVTLKCMSKKSQKYIPLMGDTRICKIAEHTFFFDIQNTAAEPPKDLLVFIPLTIKSLFWVSWDFLL